MRFALIGGLALAPHKVIRATQDVDLLVDADDADTIDRTVTTIGYRCVHRSTEAANYQRDDERLDFVYARRPIARRLLATAIAYETAFGPLRVVSAVCSPPDHRDPFEALDDLMTVVEALCPRWPERDARTTGNCFRL